VKLSQPKNRERLLVFRKRTWVSTERGVYVRGNRQRKKVSNFLGHKDILEEEKFAT